ncbi:unnamed protein product [Amoebophrya sp. A120]|nr:unnamed protein product [Amoebophrya sp. A120]|eukprot:GSA120T00011391001.1
MPGSRKGTPRGGQVPKTKVIVFDFDQTISQCHVFKCLAGFVTLGRGNFLDGPYALSERGQIQKCFEADEEMKGKFYEHCLGGKEQIAEMEKTFKKLRTNGCSLVVCSKGLVAPIRLILEKTKLLPHFDDVYARIDDYTSMQDAREYDLNAMQTKFAPEVETHIDRKDCAKWSSKAEVCLKLANGRPCMLVEDDRDEIKKGEKAGLDTCFVKDRAGLTATEIGELLEWSAKKVES